MEFIDCENCFSLYDKLQSTLIDLDQFKKHFNRFKKSSEERENIAELRDFEQQSLIDQLEKQLKSSKIKNLERIER